MLKGKRSLAMLLVLAMLLAMAPTALAVNETTVNTWSDSLFSDVSRDDWFYEDVKTAYEMGLMDGYGDRLFGPAGDITLAQTVTIAARLRSIYETGKASFVQGNPWYQVYVDYALEKGILTEAPEDYNAKATRLEFAMILANALPKDALPVINDIKDGQIPDLKDNDVVYHLYRAGVLTGSDSAGTFYPNNSIARREAAAIAARMGDPALRKNVTLLNEDATTDDAIETETPDEQPVVDVIVPGGADNEDATTDDAIETETPDEQPVVDVVVPDGANNEDVTTDDATDTEMPDEQPVVDVIVPDGAYNEGIVLVKVKETFNAADLGEIEYTSATPIYPGSKWYVITLAHADKTEEAVTYLIGLNTFEEVDYDYVMATETEGEAKVTDNPNYDKQVNLGLSNIPYGWTQNGKHPGGSPDVIVAVIDTGVDYNHLDLRNNIWVNTNETPDNGIDDDGNGYVDDVYGWDFVGNDKDPMDDNGHGTHVAGIVAAENNKVGGIGVAYGCKVMVLKAGNSSGYFNNTDIAEAIQYAYMNGASVINMSFGGSNISAVVEEALENAYNSCVLVAAAGNDSACNDLSCKVCEIVKVTYPAALPYVIGVMSTDKNGNFVSSFSNYDHNPYNTVEYEVFAVGEGVGSTWPSNKYASLNGTSMATPTVSGIAALLRSYHTDREMYSTKYIQSQIVNTGTVNPYNAMTEKVDGAHSVADVQEALNNLPKPEVNLYDYRVDDSTSISAKNNGNGVIDAGETVRLYFSLHNRGGVASNVNVSIDTYRSEIGDETLTDSEYFTIVNSTLQLSDIGTYSVRESGEEFFEILVSADCPNDYLVDFNIHYTYKNGMDEEDQTVYEDDGKQKMQFNVSSGYHLPSIISEDTVYTNDRRYIIGEDLVIPEGVTVTFKEGCEIQVYDDREYYSSPLVTVYGTLVISGTAENMVKMHPSDRHSIFLYGIKVLGNLEITYADITNAVIGPENNITTATIEINNSYLRKEAVLAGAQSTQRSNRVYRNGNVQSPGSHLGYYFGITYSSSQANVTYSNNYIEPMSYWQQHIDNFSNNVLLVSGAHAYRFYSEDFCNNIVFSPEAGNHITNIDIYDEAENNIFAAEGLADLIPLIFKSPESVSDNEFGPAYRQNASQSITGYIDSTGNPIVDVYGSLANATLLWPYVVGVEMFNDEGEAITTVGKEEITVRVTFNRAMDTTKDTFLTFGTIEPYADYRIEGEWISETVWEGTYTLKAQIENGQNFLKVNNACAAEDPSKVVFGEYQLHEFTIDTNAALAMNLQAVATESGIELTFAQDDYDTLLGYNIYRAEAKDGNYVKLNPAVVLPEETSFLDNNAEPGKTYWYTYTVVLSDFSESNPAGKVSCTAMDTMAPNLYHTPVNQGYANNNLIISCTASDNMQIASVVLYYKTVGADSWKSLEMSRVNDKFSATIFGSDVTMDGLAYYIVASDGVNTVTKGTEDEPYTVIVKDASTLSRIGDVDGNGTVTTKDALMLMMCLNGDLLLADDAFKRADLNGDGILSSAEALRIIQYVNGKVTTLAM